MGKVQETIRKAGSAVATGTAAYKLVVTVEGRPLKDRDKPAAVRVLGLPIFERDEAGDRLWFGLIARGKRGG